MAIVVAGKKKCRSCQRIKAASLFYSATQNRDGLTSYCKECHNARRKKWLQTIDPVTKQSWGRKSELRRKYGISLEQYDEMLARQGGKCAICKTAKCGSGKNLCVDHDHVTGKIRGLLCRSCNGFLGLFETHRESVIDYLKGA